jgi:hypothetical protein
MLISENHRLIIKVNLKHPESVPKRNSAATCNLKVIDADLVTFRRLAAAAFLKKNAVIFIVQYFVHWQYKLEIVERLCGATRQRRNIYWYLIAKVYILIKAL